MLYNDWWINIYIFSNEAIKLTFMTQWIGPAAINKAKLLLCISLSCYPSCTVCSWELLRIIVFSLFFSFYWSHILIMSHIKILSSSFLHSYPFIQIIKIILYYLLNRRIFPCLWWSYVDSTRIFTIWISSFSYLTI